MWISTGFKGGFFQLVVAIEELFSADRGNQSGDASLEAWKRAAGWDLLVCKRLQQRSRLFSVFPVWAQPLVALFVFFGLVLFGLYILYASQ
ncbi:hypothetical protein PS1_015795 [Malus domestica]